MSERFVLRWVDVVDVILVAFLLYKTYKMLNGTTAIKVFVGLITFIFVWWVVTAVFQMQLLGAFLDQIVNVGAIALIILFQEEIRQWLTMLGSKQNFVMRFLTRIFSSKSTALEDSDVMQIVVACKNMARGKIGALIVLKNEKDLKGIEVTGEQIDASINSRLIENIFFKNSPLHDGAMIISKDRIVAAGCILPVSHSFNIPKSLGLRHRAALGMSEVSDAACLVVSEETGDVSICMDGMLKKYEDLTTLKTDLEAILGVKPVEESVKHRNIFDKLMGK